MKRTLQNYRAVLALRDARRLIAADALAKAGDWLLYVAVSLILYRASGVAALGMFNAIRILVPVLFSPAAGRRGGAYRPRDVMVTANVVRAAGLLAAALVAWLGASVWFVMGAVLLCSLATAWFAPAERRLQRDLVGAEERSTVFAVLGTTGTLVLVVAPALGALLSGWLSPAALLALTSAVFVVSTTLLLRVASPEPQEQHSGEPAHGGTGSALRSALGAVRADRRVASSVLCQGAACWAVGASLVLLLPVAEGAAGHDTALGWLTAAIGLGSTLGMLGGAPMAQRQLMVPGAACIAALGVLLAGLAAVDGVVIALLVTFAMGVVANVPEPLYWTVYANRVSEERSGSVYGLVESVISGTMTLGGAVAGMVADSFGLTAACAVTGGFTAVCAVLALALVRSAAPRARGRESVAEPVETVQP